MGLRAAQPAIFGLAALSFLLPFAHVSCAGESEVFSSEEVAEDRTADLKGYELVIGADVVEHVDLSRDEIPGPAGRFGAEPFAVLALAAAVGGAAGSLLAPWHQRATAGLIAGGAGILSLVALGLAPAMRALGVTSVEWRLGYWTCLVLFASATAFSWLEYRRVPRPPPNPPL